ncbi:MAG: hypothetical protein H6605_02825 [Flavobacteriales bacterium]|nr:hypothetical protein [Flavobacteriales bacterium]
MKIKSGKKILLLSLIFCMLFVACKKEDAQTLNSSDFVSYGNNANLELITLLPTSDGGFIAGLNSYKNGNKDILILKYSSNLDLEWQRELGTVFKEDLQKIIVTKTNEILVAGFSEGFMQTNLPVTQRKKNNIYLIRMDMQGKISRENSLDFDPSNRQDIHGLGDFYISDVLEESDAGILVTGYSLLNESFAGGGFTSYFGFMLKTDDAGNFQKRFQFPKMPESITETQDAYLIHFFTFFDEEAGYFKVLKSRSGGTYNQLLDTTIFPFYNNRLPETNYARYKLLPDADHILYDYCFPDHINRYEYNIPNDQIEYKRISLPEGPYNSAFPLDDHKVLFSKASGEIMILNSGSIEAFAKTKFPITKIIRTKGDYFIVASISEQKFNVYKFNVKDR